MPRLNSTSSSTISVSPILQPSNPPPATRAGHAAQEMIPAEDENALAKLRCGSGVGGSSRRED